MFSISLGRFLVRIEPPWRAVAFFTDGFVFRYGSEPAHAVRNIGTQGSNALSAVQTSFKHELDVTDKRNLFRKELRVPFEHPANRCFLIALPRHIQPRIIR